MQVSDASFISIKCYCFQRAFESINSDNPQDFHKRMGAFDWFQTRFQTVLSFRNRRSGPWSFRKENAWIVRVGNEQSEKWDQNSGFNSAATWAYHLREGPLPKWSSLFICKHVGWMRLSITALQIKSNSLSWPTGRPTQSTVCLHLQLHPRHLLLTPHVPVTLKLFLILSGLHQLLPHSLYMCHSLCLDHSALSTWLVPSQLLVL